MRESSIRKGTASAVPPFVGSSRALAPEGIFFSALKRNQKDGKNVPQWLKPGMAVSFFARLKPCPSGADVSHRLKPLLA